MRQKLGQHFLRDGTVSLAMVNEARINVAANEVVVEVGPGKGALTEVLLQTHSRVLAVEWDESLGILLADRYKDNSRFTLIHADIRHFDLVDAVFKSGAKEYTIIANLPYYLTSYLFRQIFSYQKLPKQVIVLIQKEVAERIAAPAGSSDRSALSVLCQAYADPRIMMAVPPEAFSPPPRVNSAVLVLDSIDANRMSGFDQRRFMRIVKAGFGEKRKTLANSISGGLRLEKAEAEMLLSEAGVDSARRAQDLSVDQWKALYRGYKGD